MDYRQLKNEVVEVITDKRNIEKVKSINELDDWRDWRTGLAEEMASYEDAVSYFIHCDNFHVELQEVSLGDCILEMQRAIEEIADEWHKQNIGTFDFKNN